MTIILSNRYNCTHSLQFKSRPIKIAQLWKIPTPKNQLRWHSIQVKPASISTVSYIYAISKICITKLENNNKNESGLATENEVYGTDVTETWVNFSDSVKANIQILKLITSAHGSDH